MWISEIFESIQGEGRFLGVRSGFVRTSGCNLRCRFCDTPYTSWTPQGNEVSLTDLLLQLEKMSATHMVLTGGEPILTPDLIPLTRELRERNYVITIETAGTVFREGIVADLMSISPKMQNSTPVGTNWELRHNQRRHRPEVIERLTKEYDYQFKFVIDVPEDLLEVAEYLQQFPHIDPEKVYLMPEGTSFEAITSKKTWLAAAAEAHGWKMTPRLHIELFGNTRGT